MGNRLLVNAFTIRIHRHTDVARRFQLCAGPRAWPVELDPKSFSLIVLETQHIKNRT
jgi:hypothetical protein